MNSVKIDDTIAAIATGLGESGVGIVRMSGPRALSVADKVFKSKDAKLPSEYKTYTVHYGWIVDPSSVVRRPSSVSANEQRLNTNDGIIDEVLLTIMRAPRSYTREDVVEINCHGGIVAMRRVLDVVLENGCRLGNPGEFTMRAFLNGRIDLAQAEAVVDLIRAKTDSALSVASSQLEGHLSHFINNIRAGLIEILSELEAGIDFPDDDIGAADYSELKIRTDGFRKELADKLASSKHGQVLREGVQAVICGRPNVGKSSLLNALLKKERCIVSSVAGTTRDTIEEIIDIRGIPVRIVDTAGIIEPRDIIEKKAVERSNKFIETAGLIIFVFDGSKKLTRQDQSLMRILKKKPVIAAINKADLPQRIDKKRIQDLFPNHVELSAKKLSNIGLLEELIEKTVCKNCLDRAGSDLVSSRRHIECLKAAQKSIAEAFDSLDNKLSAEFPAQSVKDALKKLDAVIGKDFSAELIEKIFSEFCIGK